jgi:putative inorganic carbon (HCO3(-)) transporter
MSLRGVLLLVFFLPSLPMCLFRPFYGILLWLIFAILNLQWYAWGAATALPWSMAVAIPTIAGFFLFERGWKHLWSREFGLILAMWIWFTITSLISTNTPLFAHHAHDTWQRWDFVSKILLMAVVMIAVIHDQRRLRITVLVIAVCFGIMTLKSLPFIIATHGAYRVYGPQYSMIADNNDFGLALNMTLPLFFFLAKIESNKWVKRLFILLFLITIPEIFFTYSRGALLGLLAVLLLMLFHVKQRLAVLCVIVFAIIIALLFAPQSWKMRMDPERPGALDPSALSRLNSWSFCWHLASDYPFTGGGFETFTPPLFDIYAPDVRDVHGPHSIYFGVLAEHGFPGLLLYLALIAACFRTTTRVVKRARLLGNSLPIHYANMFRLSLVGFLTSGAFLGRSYFDYFFTIVSCIAVLGRIYLRDPEPGTLVLEADTEWLPEEQPA